MKENDIENGYKLVYVNCEEPLKSKIEKIIKDKGLKVFIPENKLPIVFSALVSAYTEGSLDELRKEIKRLKNIIGVDEPCVIPLKNESHDEWLKQKAIDGAKEFKKLLGINEIKNKFNDDIDASLSEGEEYD